MESGVDGTDRPILNPTVLLEAPLCPKKYNATRALKPERESVTNYAEKPWSWY